MAATAEQLFYRGARLASLGRQAEAAAAYTRSLEIQPTSHVALENLGIALSDSGRRHEAIYAFSQAVQLAPGRSEAYSLLARAEYEVGRRDGIVHFKAAIALDPMSPSLHYEIARTDQLFGDGRISHEYFASAQRLAYAQWRSLMGCSPLEAGAPAGGPTHWSRQLRHGDSSIRRVEAFHAARGASYGRHAPRPFAARSWPGDAGLTWPPLVFADAPIVVVELHDVYVSGNDGVVSDNQCNLFLPSHGFEVPLHLNLPEEPPFGRHLRDGSIRRIGFGADDAGTVVVSLAQLFAANFYSFLADCIARLAVALEALPLDRTLRVALPSDRSKLKPWMWAILERLGIGKHNSFPYDIWPYHGGALRRAKAVRLHAHRLLLIDWQDGPLETAARRSDLAHLPSRAALRMLRERLAFPGAHLAWSSLARTRVVYLQRAAAATRRIANEPVLLTALAEAVSHAMPVELCILSDAPSAPLAHVGRSLSHAVVVVGVHGAGWANLLFVRPVGAHAIELGLPEAHAIYTAHIAYALGLEFHLIPLQGVALHSAPAFIAPVKTVAAAVQRALKQAGLQRAHRDVAERMPAQRSPSVEVVVARYKEDVGWCAEYNCTVYSKDERAPSMAQMRQVARWRQLPNIGRESHTILSHIVENFDGLADWTVFMQGDPWDHFPVGINVDSYVNASRVHAAGGSGAFFLLTGVATADLQSLAFRTGYAPFAPFTGALVGPPGRWADVNRARVPLFRQPLGLWSGHGEVESSAPPGAFVNLTDVAVPYRNIDAGLVALQCPLHWIEERQHDRQGLARLWHRFMDSEPPSRLYHAHGAQFAVSASALRRRPRSFYQTMLDELRSRDPVSSYYMELMWWYVFDDSGEAAVAEQW
jgi:hypothetical protein